MYLRFGLLGERISYSLSPAIFEKLLRAANLSGEYRLYDLGHHRAEEFLKSESRAWSGLNVTTPHKQLAAQFCNSLSERAQTVNAVNVITSGEGRLTGDNTDIDGFRFAFRRAYEGRLLPERVLVIGSGGAARAVLFVLSEELPSACIEIASTNPTRARERIEGMNTPFASVSYLAYRAAFDKLTEYQFVVQCTPLGSAKSPGCPLDTSLKFSHTATVIDLVYVPLRTPFLRYAKESGARIANGLTMLIAQAVASLDIWTGVHLSTEKMVHTLLPQLGNE